jgi:ribose/xylose/arabinose/galactoside ABC-type transport system permease subunit
MSVGIGTGQVDGQGVPAPRSGLSIARLRRIVARNGLTLFFAAFAIGLAVLNPRFLEINNLINVAKGASIVGIMACGMTVTMIGGGFDLSVARTAALCSVVLVQAQLLGIVPAILVTLAVALIVGLVNGTLIVRARVNPFVVTLGMMSIVGSAALLASGGRFLDQTADWVPSLGQGEIAFVPTPIFWWLVIAIACHFLLAYTRIGRYIDALGGNPEAARHAGVPVGRITLLTYIVVALTAGVAGIVLVGRLDSASAIALPGVELDVIAAVIIGGTKLSGGSGTIPKTIIGTLILATLSNGVVLLGVEPYWQGILKGAVVIAAVAFDVFQRSRRRTAG